MHWEIRGALCVIFILILVKCSALWASGSEPTGSDVGIE